ncbi:MAG: EAL domain-containing protein [Pseudomonadota bacterium]
MRRRGVVRALFVAAFVLSLGPLIAVDFTLKSYADLRGQSEAEAAAQRYASRADRLLDQAFTLLKETSDRGFASCRTEARQEMRRLVWSIDAIDFLGLVDSNGYVMCAEPLALSQKGSILPARTPESQAIEIGLEPDMSPGSARPLVSWTLADSTRLVARIANDSLALDAGPDYLRKSRRVEVRVGGGDIWYSIGRAPVPEVEDPAGADGDNPAEAESITVEIASSKYPLTTFVSVGRQDARSLIEPLERGAIAAAFGFFIVTSMIAIAVGLRSEDTTADEIQNAIREREFVPFYQPVVDIDSGRIQGCEVLVRWIKNDGTVVSPGAFMQYAENSGAIFEITRQLMEKAAVEVGPLYRSHPDLKISINLFAGHFDDHRIVQDTEAIFGESAIAYDQLVFEVTERSPLRDLEAARKIIAEFHALGVRIALDDAGTGHGGLAYLQNLGIDIIKIDKMFIDALATDHASSAIVDTLVELGGNLGMGIVAEGVETMQQIERLRKLGVTAAQGFIFAPALPGDVFIDLTRRLAPLSSAMESDEAAEASDEEKPETDGGSETEAVSEDDPAIDADDEASEVPTAA